jgi:hypothetical protein
MHALAAYLNGVGGSPRGRGARDEGAKLDVLNVLMHGGLVRDARTSSQDSPSRREPQRRGRSRDPK